MLKALMAKISYYEKELDKDVETSGKRKLSESSFSPCEYPPREVNGTTVQRASHMLEDEELYLPCHYFTFIGGTSTGGYVLSFLSFYFSKHMLTLLKTYQHNDIEISNDSLRLYKGVRGTGGESLWSSSTTWSRNHYSA
jgi:hypothetical protein